MKAYSVPPKPHNWFKGCFAAGGNGGGLWKKVAEVEGNGETEREREWEGTGKRNNALIVGD